MADIELVIKIPEEQIKKSLEESKYIHEDEGEKGFVNIIMHYTNASLEFVYVERKTDFYSCEYKILPKGHGRLIDADEILEINEFDTYSDYIKVSYAIDQASTIIKADRK